VETWLECLLTSGGNYDLCGRSAKNSVPYWAWLGEHFFMASQGILAFLLYGTMENNFYLWYGLLTGKGFKYESSNTNSPENRQPSRLTTNKPTQSQPQLENVELMDVPSTVNNDPSSTPSSKPSNSLPNPDQEPLSQA